VSGSLDFVSGELAGLESASLLRSVRAVDGPPDTEVIQNGRSLLLLASNNYLGLATHPRVVDAAAEAASRWGAGSGAARLVTGGTRLHDDLEAMLADFKQTEAALLFSSGYMANLGVLAALAGREDMIFSDELNHASIIDGVRLSRAAVRVYRHCDVEHLAELLAENRGARRRIVVTDTVFSMDGDLAPLARMAEVCEAEGAILIADEAHATGVVGPCGRGAVAHFGCEAGVHAIVGTLSKALGAAGGFVAGSADLISFLRNRARPFVFDTALPASPVAAAQAALEVLVAEPGLADRARANASTFAAGLRARGFDVLDPAAAIVPVLVGEASAAIAMAERLRAAGVLVPAIRPPSVPEGTARLRATTMATHTDSQIEFALDAFARAAKDA